MATMSYSEYLAAQKQAEENRANRSNFSDRPRVGFFKLADDGDEAIVRFNYTSLDDFKIYQAHSIKIDERFRKVKCLRESGDPASACPLCNAGVKYSNRVYLQMVQYDRAEDGSIIATPKVWDRPASYADILASYIIEYGDISKLVFKVKRKGKKGDMQTEYTILVANQAIYNEQLYPSDFTVFNGYSELGGPLMVKDFNGMKELVSDASVVEVAKPERFEPEPNIVSDQLPFAYQSPYTTIPEGGQRRVTY